MKTFLGRQIAVSQDDTGGKRHPCMKCRKMFSSKRYRLCCRCRHENESYGFCGGAGYRVYMASSS
jgi:hypothetical protein